ncbi:MAG: succinylglutamate desuccinylase/aspartoacylase family protein [Atopobiaceae bacterium]|nr:succinylglutamate desuccinylase/aspartoacylase family protein [Atopobiaceae bacterium]
MRSGVLYRMEVPHREPADIVGFDFGSKDGERACAIVGSTRGNEVQQTYICANLVARLEELERAGAFAPNKNVLVIPCVNPHSMNVGTRFWPANGTDINRRFPGNAQGSSTERVANAIMHVIRTYKLGIQLCSFNQPGDFLPHVRVVDAGPISDESLGLAADFGLPYVMSRKPSPFDTATLNYAWQASGSHAFSVYSRATDRLDVQSARQVEEAALRFLVTRGVLSDTTPVGTPQAEPVLVRESDLVDVRTERAAGFLVSSLRAGDHVCAGQELAQVLDTRNARVLETLRSPIDGRVFFLRTDPLVQQQMVVFRIAP